VFGVAILGSIVNAKLTGDLAARLKAIGIPPNFQSLVIHAVQTGGTSGGAAGSAEHSKDAAISRIATKVVNAAYDAFGSGLHEALVLSGCLVLVGAVVAACTIHRRSRQAFEVERRAATVRENPPPSAPVGTRMRLPTANERAMRRTDATPARRPAGTDRDGSNGGAAATSGCTTD